MAKVKCEYYFFRFKKDAWGERPPCAFFNAGRCEMHDSHSDIFEPTCPYRQGTRWSWEKVEKDEE